MQPPGGRRLHAWGLRGAQQQQLAVPVRRRLAAVCGSAPACCGCGSPHAQPRLQVARGGHQAGRQRRQLGSSTAAWRPRAHMHAALPCPAFSQGGCSPHARDEQRASMAPWAFGAASRPSGSGRSPEAALCVHAPGPSYATQGVTPRRLARLLRKGWRSPLQAPPPLDDTSTPTAMMVACPGHLRRCPAGASVPPPKPRSLALATFAIALWIGQGRPRGGPLPQPDVSTPGGGVGPDRGRHHPRHHPRGRGPEAVVSALTIPPPCCGMASLTPQRARASLLTLSTSMRPPPPPHTRGASSCGRWHA